MNPVKVRQVLLLVAAVCTYVAEEIIAPTEPRVVTARRRQTRPLKVRSTRAA